MVALFPLLALAANNYGEVLGEEVLRPLVATLLLALLVWLIASRLFESRPVAMAISSVILLVALSYGQFYEGLKLLPDPLPLMARHRYLVPLLAILLVVLTAVARRLVKADGVSAGQLNLYALLILAIPLGQLVLLTAHEARRAQLEKASGETVENPAWVSKQRDGEPLPDIYYIVLDEYARADTLREEFGFDNGPFLEELRSLGFYVAECSRSNYVQTRLSLNASLNLAYVDELNRRLDTPFGDFGVGNPSLKNNRVMNLLDSLGYRLVAFRTGYFWADFEDADVYITADIPATMRTFRALGLTRFEFLYLNSTIGRLATDANLRFPSLLGESMSVADQEDRIRVMHAFEALEEMPKLAGPKFVYAHIISPHGPYVFGPNGGFPDPKQSDLEGYINNVRFVNSRLVEILPSLIEESPVPPIIVVQGDHGAKTLGAENEEERIPHYFRNLNAFYLPGERPTDLHPSLSVVNTFRVVFNYAFGAELPLLPDRSYHAGNDSSGLREIPANCSP